MQQLPVAPPTITTSPTGAPTANLRPVPNVMKTSVRLFTLVRMETTGFILKRHTIIIYMISGAAHADDTVYVLSSNVDVHTTKRDSQMAELVTDMWVNYASNR